MERHTWHCPFALLHHRLYNLDQTGVSISDILGLRLDEMSDKVAYNE
jgi:hypothetical protein